MLLYLLIKVGHSILHPFSDIYIYLENYKQYKKYLNFSYELVMIFNFC